MAYLRPSWLMVSAMAVPLVNIGGAQATPPHATGTAAPSTRTTVESLTQDQRQATLTAMQASVDKQRASVAAGVAGFTGKQTSAKEATPTADAFFTLPPLPPSETTGGPDATGVRFEMANTALPGLFCDPVREEDIATIVLDAAQREGLEPRLLTAVIRQESAFRPCAVSPKGAQGLMQLMPATAQEFSVRDPFDIQENIGAGARYLKELLTRYTGDLPLALGAYNSGRGTVDAAGAVPPIPETAAYVRGILRQLAAPPTDLKPPQ